VSTGPERWLLLNPEQIDNWIERCNPSDERVREVVLLIGEILDNTPGVGLQTAVLLGLPRFHALTGSGYDSITWSVLTAYGEWPRGVFISQIEPAIPRN
jgi:hypothetical protein